MNIHPVILCGGSGTRLWPMSRGGYPKQYLKLTSDKTLLQQTVLRLNGIADVTAPIVVTNNEQRFLVAEQLREVGTAPSSIVLEPVGRNTAPAIAVAALLALRSSPDALLLVLPSDHVILNEAAFARITESAADVAKDDYLVTFGINPTEPHTGYGYIRRGSKIGATDGAFGVAESVEKPDADKAARFIEEGGYYWNSGMFLLKASTYMEELRRYEPEVARQTVLSLELAKRDEDFLRLDPGAFHDCPSVSVDYAVMERTDRASVIAAADLGWNDIGSWTALAEIAESDDAGNTLLGDVLVENVTNSYIRAEHRMVAAIGIDNIVIVETADAILVTHRDSTQDVKKIVERLRQRGGRSR